MKLNTLDNLTAEQRRYITEMVGGQQSGEYRSEMYFMPAMGQENEIMLDPKGAGHQIDVASGITSTDLIALQDEGYVTLRPGKNSTALLLKQKAFQEVEAAKRGVTQADSDQYGDRVFIGHGRSLVWFQLRDFLEKKLHLHTDEFNRESTAGLTTAERLDQMLGDSGFAFIVMTAEDSRADGSVHTRENVVHEIGLFQGRLGFRRAIILLEEGCAAFSNIHGLTYIPFPSSDLSPSFQQIREVLEREEMIQSLGSPELSQGRP